MEGKEAKEYLLDLSAPPPMPSGVELEFVDTGSKGKFKLPPCFKFEDIENWPEKHRKYILSRIHPQQIKRWGIGYVDKCRCPKHRHRNRIALPVRDENGIPCSYTARGIVSGALRYAEPEASENASRCLYGAENWKGDDIVIVTEGIFDALAIENICDFNICALRGSNPHPLDLVKLTRFAIIVVVLDPDAAGEKLKLAIKASCGRHSDVRFIALPRTKGKDGKKIDAAKLCETEDGKRYLRNRLETCLNNGN